jgi:hypothetical protein
MKAGARRHAVLFGAVIALLAVLSLPGIPGHANDVDVLLYSAAAVRANAEGALPYVAAWIEKGPVAMGSFQALFALFGDYNLLAIAAWWFVLVSLGSAVSWALAREMGFDAGAPWAAVLFAFGIGPLGGTLNTEVPAMVAAAAAVLVWCRASRLAAPPVGLGVLAGLLAGTAFMCRQNAGAVWPLLVVAEAVLVGSGRRSVRQAATGALAITAGFLGVVAAVVIPYGAAGALREFWFCFYAYNADIYVAATRVTAGRLVASPLVAARNFLLPSWTVGTLGLLGIVLAFSGRLRPREDPADRRPARLVVAAAAVGLTASLFLGLRLFSHYFALVLPLWAALGGATVETLGRWAKKLSGNRTPASFPVLAVALVVAASLGAEILDVPWRATASRLLNWARDGGMAEISDPLRWPGRDGHAAAAARYLREHSSASDRLFVWGMRPHVYVYSRRTPATRFVTCTFLTGLVPWERSAPEDDTTPWIVAGAWDLLMEDLEREPPLFIVDASEDHLFGMGAYSPSRFPPLDAFLRERYERVHELGNVDRMIVWRRLGS